MNLFLSFAIIAVKKEQQLAVALSPAGDHFIYPVHCRATVGWNLPIHFVLFAIFIMILEGRGTFISQLICAPSAMMKWASTIRFDPSRCLAATKTHGVTNYACKSTHKRRDTF